MYIWENFDITVKMLSFRLNIVIISNILVAWLWQSIIAQIIFTINVDLEFRTGSIEPLHSFEWVSRQLKIFDS